MENIRTFILQHCLKRGNFVLSSGKTSSFYIDLRVLSLNNLMMPVLGREILKCLGKEWPFGLAGEGFGAFPLVCSAAYAAAEQGRSLQACLVRKEPKQHGQGRQLEGVALWEKGADVVVLEDTSTTGDSLFRCCEIVEREGFSVRGIVTVVDRSSGLLKRKCEDRNWSYQRLFSWEELTEGAT